MLLLVHVLVPQPVSFSKKLYIPSSKTKPGYQNVKAMADSIKRFSHSNKTLAGIAFSSYLDHQLIPYWIGTPWDFNGTTETPRQGYIACGYFVTTLLRDAGVKLNRVKLAQLASEQMIRSLTTRIEHYSSTNFASFIQAVKSKGEGISIVGLDNHTGFLYYNGKELYFIHSSYVGTASVAREIASENAILQYSKYRVVGYISHDPRFIQRWLSN